MFELPYLSTTVGVLVYSLLFIPHREETTDNWGEQLSMISLPRFSFILHSSFSLLKSRCLFSCYASWVIQKFIGNQYAVDSKARPSFIPLVQKRKHRSFLQDCSSITSGRFRVQARRKFWFNRHVLSRRGLPSSLSINFLSIPFSLSSFSNSSRTNSIFKMVRHLGSANCSSSRSVCPSAPLPEHVPLLYRCSCLVPTHTSQRIPAICTACRAIQLSPVQFVTSQTGLRLCLTSRSTPQSCIPSHPLDLYTAAMNLLCPETVHLEYYTKLCLLCCIVYCT